MNSSAQNMNQEIGCFSYVYDFYSVKKYDRRVKTTKLGLVETQVHFIAAKNIFGFTPNTTIRILVSINTNSISI